jgi:hypothetical protein
MLSNAINDAVDGVRRAIFPKLVADIYKAASDLTRRLVGWYLLVMLVYEFGARCSTTLVCSEEFGFYFLGYKYVPMLSHWPIFGLVFLHYAWKVWKVENHISQEIANIMVDSSNTDEDMYQLLLSKLDGVVLENIPRLLKIIRNGQRVVSQSEYEEAMLRSVIRIKASKLARLMWFVKVEHRVPVSVRLKFLALCKDVDAPVLQKMHTACLAQPIKTEQKLDSFRVNTIGWLRTYRESVGKQLTYSEEQRHLRDLLSLALTFHNSIDDLVHDARMFGTLADFNDAGNL